MNYFFVGNWEHTGPEQKYRADGRRAIIKQLCVGPLETIIYGITEDSQYYLEHRIMEGIQEGDIFYRQIDKTEIKNAILNEIELCRKYHADEMIPFFQAEIEKITRKNNDL